MKKFSRLLNDTASKTPRQTLWARKARQQKAEGKQGNDLESITPSEQDFQPCVSEPVENNRPDSPVETPPLVPSISDTDEELSLDTEASQRQSKRRKLLKRKQKAKDKEPFGADVQHSSDENYSSDTSSESDGSTEQTPCTAFHQETVVEEGLSSDDCEDNSSAAYSDSLCPCVKTTVNELLFMTLSLGLRHGLSWAAQVDILKMMRTIFGSDRIPLSKNNFIKKLNAVQESDINYHVYCDVCNSYLGKRDKSEKHCGMCKKVFGVDDCEDSLLDKCDSCNCSLIEKKIKVDEMYCQVCDSNINVGVATNLFVSVSIESQLQKFVRDGKFTKNIMEYRFKRQYIPGVYSDVYDGDVYRKLSDNNGILSSPLNMSYNFFTDGVAYGKSTTVKTIWPIYLTINELPYEERQKYLILAGVYAGAKDPSENWFLHPFVAEANKLSQDGFTWTMHEQPVVSLVIPLAFIADSVARYQMLNRQTFHAKFGCTFCYQESIYIRSVKCQCYVPFLTEKPVSLRSKESHLLDVEESKKQQHHNDQSLRHYRGVKGACQLDNLNFFSVVDNVVVDYMHSILGLVKKHMELITQPIRKHFWLPSLAKSAMVDIISAVDLIISQIQSNTSVIRELRPLSDLAMWKASEWRSWLLFYCIPCLKNFLKPKHLVHFGMLSKATFLLLQKEVTHYHITHAMELFQNYICLFQKYFFEENMVYNTHLLTHIPEGVFNFGPIWGHNSFLYESKNRHILALSKSPYFLSYQVARKFLVFQSLPSLCNELVRDKTVMTFCGNIMNYKKLLKVSRSSDGNCVLVGTPVCHTLQENEVTDITQVCSAFNSDYCFSYERMYYKKKRFTTKEYGIDKKNNDSFAFLRDGRCVQIASIVKLPVINTVLLGVNFVKVSRKPLHQNDLYKFDTVKCATSTLDVKLINVNLIDKPCFSIKISDDFCYIADIPFGCTVE